MLRHKAYKTRLDLNKAQEGQLWQCIGIARYVYNWALADRIEKYKADTPTNLYEQKRRFNAIKSEIAPFVRQVPCTVTEETFRNLDTAYKNFFRRVKQGTEAPGFPKFKSRYAPRKTFSVRGSIHVEPRRVKLPIIGWLRLHERGYLPTEGVKILKATVSNDQGAWWISLQVEEDIPEPPTPGTDVIGVDVGIKTLAVVSDGRQFENPKALAVYQQKLARAQREVSRRKKGSANRKKSQQRVTKLHAKIARIRAAAHHNASHKITETPGVGTIVIEHLNVKGMVQNRKLAKAVSDASMSELHRQIEYKAEWAGKTVLRADRWYPSSKTCSVCGHVKADLTLADRVYVCSECGTRIDRDLNAARNLAALGEPTNGRGLPGELGCDNALL